MRALLLALLFSSCALFQPSDATPAERATRLLDNARRAAVVMHEGYATPDGGDPEKARRWLTYARVIEAAAVAVDPEADAGAVLDSVLAALEPALGSPDPDVREDALKLRAALLLLLP